MEKQNYQDRSNPHPAITLRRLVPVPPVSASLLSLLSKPKTFRPLPHFAIAGSLPDVAGLGAKCLRALEVN